MLITSFLTVAAVLLLGLLWRYLPFSSSDLPTPSAPAHTPSAPTHISSALTDDQQKYYLRNFEAHGNLRGRNVCSSQQQQYCSSVKAEAQDAADKMSHAYRLDDRAMVIEQLNELERIFKEQQCAGHDGIVALTEYCNVVRVALA